MSDRQFERALTDWLEDGSDRTPKRALDGVLFAVKTTPQERDLGIPWRLPMPAFARVALAVAIVAMVGAGGLFFLSNRDQGNVATQPTASASAAPTATASPSASASPAPSIDVPTGWTPFTSPVHGFTLAYPEGWQASAATGSTDADEFVSADNDIGIGVRRLPAGDDADVATIDGLNAWAQRYCNLVSPGACDTVIDRAEAMCLDAGDDPCRSAILVRSVGTNPADEGEYAFFGDWAGANPGSAPDFVIVAATGRGDTYPGAAPFGGAVQLLKTMLASMGVTPTTSASGSPTPGIDAWTPFTSPVYGYSMSYPKGWEADPAAREWQPSDGPAADSTSDIFVSADNDVGFGVVKVPAGDGADLESVEGLKAWAEAYCDDIGRPACDTFTARTEPMCLDAGDVPCRAAIIVRSDGTDPEDDGEYAFFKNWHSATPGSAPDTVIVIGTGRGDAYPGAAQYGGAVELLKSVLAQMNITSAP